KARAAKNKAESAKALAGAHRLFDQGKYADAKKEAYRAANLHGPYSMWDFGDRADKLIPEIEEAEAKSRKVKVPAVPGSPNGTALAKKPDAKPAGTAVAKKPDSGPPAPTAKPGAMPTAVVQQPAMPAPSWPSDLKTADVTGAEPKG